MDAGKMIVTSQKSKIAVKTTKVILDAAAIEFAQEGFAGARMDGIADRAGVNKATIYYHIGDKAVLYREVLIGVLGRIADDLDERIDEVEPYAEKLRAYICAISTNITSTKLFPPIIMREVASGGENLPIEVREKMGRIVSQLKEILKEGAKKGELRETDPKLTHLMIIGGINFYVAGEPIRKQIFAPKPDGAERGNETYEDLGEKIAEIILNGLKS